MRPHVHYLLLMCPGDQSCPTLCNSVECRLPDSRPWYFLGKNTGMGCHFPLQGIFLAQALNPQLLHLLHWQTDSLSLAPPKKPVHCLELGTIASLLSAQLLWSQGCPLPPMFQMTCHIITSAKIRQHVLGHLHNQWLLVETLTTAQSVKKKKKKLLSCTSRLEVMLWWS